MKMPFDRWLQRIMHRAVRPCVVEAVLVLVGEDRLRAQVSAKESDRVRGVVRRIERKLVACRNAVGKLLRVDSGEKVRRVYGEGRVILRGVVKKATLVIVEDDVMHIRSLAYEVELVLPTRTYTLVVDELHVFEEAPDKP